MRDHVLEKFQVRGDAFDPRLSERSRHPSDRRLGRVAAGDDLHEQGIVERRHDRAGVRAARVDAHAEARGDLAGGQASVRGRETVGRVLGGHATLERVPRQRDRLLPRHAGIGLADSRPGRDAELRLHDVDPGDLLGDRVLDLQPGVELDEVEGPRLFVDEELDGSGIRVAGGPSQGERGVAERRALGFGQERGRRPLGDLLMPPLHGAIALEQVHERSVQIAEDLDLDVARPAQQPFRVHLVLAEGSARLAPGRLDERGELRRRLGDTQAAAAAAAAGLDHERKADRGRERFRLLHVAGQGTGAGERRDTDRPREGPGCDLVTQGAQHVFARTDERDAGARARDGHLGLRGEKAVARMDRVDARPARHADHVVHVEVGVDRRPAGAHQIALVGGEAMPGGAILLGEDRDRAHLQLARRAHDADGDLAAVGDEEASDLLAHDPCLIYASATSILSPSAPITIAKTRLSERSEVR